MKMIRRLIKQLDDLRQPSDCQASQLKSDRPIKLDFFKQSIKYPSQRPNQWWNWLRNQPSSSAQAPLPPVSKRCRSAPRKHELLQSGLAVTLSVVTLTAAMGQRFYRQPELQVGTEAPKTIFAPADVVVVDEETTETRRSNARNGAVPVLIPDMAKNSQIEASLESLFQQASTLRRQAGRFPFIAPSRLSIATQRSVREVAPADWKAIWSVIRGVYSGSIANDESARNFDLLLTTRTDFQALSLPSQRLVRELLEYQQSRSPADLRSLQLQFETARKNYQQASDELARLASAERSLPNNAVLFQLTETDWKTTQKEIRLALNRMLLQGIAEGIPSDLLMAAGETHLRGQVSEEAEGLAKELLAAVLAPNLIEDPVRTRTKAEAAAENVPEVVLTAQEDEIIVRRGDQIDQAAFVLLDEFGLSRRRLNVWGLTGFGVLIGVGAGVFLWVEQTARPALRKQDHGLVVFMLLGVAGLNVIGLAVYSLPAVGLLVSSFYGATLGSALVGLLTLALPIGARVGTIPLLASATGAIVCSFIAPRLRSREELALLGGVVGLIQGAVYLALTWLMTPVSLATWYLPLTGAILQGIYGVVSSVVALGLSPYLEHLFDLVTPIRLAELSSPNRPMLKRLASEAPGTFQHTLFVSSLAEAAARALRCNVELVRAGTLYHDIGKMHDPMGFIENQMGGPNKHDEINNPWASADIIKKHVSEGLVMARRCRLPKAIRAFIPEHQGNMLISYFYYQAKERAESDPTLVVDEQDFRYVGPAPQCPETGIVMLADSCEAALRSLKDASPEEALAMVNRILKARWRDQQLVDSGLTREHMSMIAEVFVQVWQQYNHKRIAYPKAALSPVVGHS